MTPQSDLEIKGNFLTHPFAELLAEIAQACVSGSLSVADKDRKCVIYFKDGSVVFAVSNARTSRLYEILLKRGRITKEDIVRIPNFASDFEFAAYLEDKNFLNEDDIKRLFSEQIESILVDILSWQQGDWSFSSLKRVRDGLSFDVEAKRLLLEYGRCLSTDSVLARFRSLDERFHRSSDEATRFDLAADEGFVLSRTDTDPLTVADLTSIAAMTDADALHVIYKLWLAGLIVRLDWQPAFSAHTVAAMRGATLQIKQEAKPAQAPAAPVPVAPPKPDPLPEPVKEPQVELTLDQYLEQIENAKTHYDVLGIDPKTESSDLKKAYFSLARNFHPDRYHSEGGETLRRIQDAFTQLAQAHETLKNPEAREIYDYKMRKELAEREKSEAAGKPFDISSMTLQIEQAAQNFERGFSLLMDDEFEDAIPFLARAAHYAPKNARYRAYYGRALSIDESQRHKAEGEMQAAIKLDPNNPTYRILLAEFFIQVNLLKRAEGELNRLLAVFPSNHEAQDLLASLRS